MNTTLCMQSSVHFPGCYSVQQSAARCSKTSLSTKGEALLSRSATSRCSRDNTDLLQRSLIEEVGTQDFNQIFCNPSTTFNAVW